MICVIVPGVWAGLGPGCIIYLAALKAIPEEVYEAADLDGAGAWYKIRHITIPFLKPLIVIQFVGAVIGAFRSWEGIFVMTGGGPKDSTLVVGMEVWYNAFAYLRFGYATALAWVLGAVLIGFTVMQLRILRNARFTTVARS
jgi:multiple sugar transport system permease protein